MIGDTQAMGKNYLNQKQRNITRKVHNGNWYDMLQY